MTDDLGEGAAERLRSEPDLLPILEDYRSRFLAGRFGSMADVLHQPEGSREMSLETAVIFAELMTALTTGRLLVAAVEAGFTLSTSADQEQIRDALGRLPAPFLGHFREDAGTLLWSAPIEVATVRAVSPRSVEVLAPSDMGAPLTVGPCPCEAVFARIVFGSGLLARWPVGHDRITLLEGRRFREWRRQIDPSLESRTSAMDRPRPSSPPAASR